MMRAADLLDRIVVRLTLTATEPLMPGASIQPSTEIAAEEFPPLDKAHVAENTARVARRGDGAVMVNGTAVAGVLAATLGRRRGRESPELFGAAVDHGSSSTSATSPLRVASIVIQDPTVRTRTRAPSNRSTGGAADRLLHSAERVLGPVAVDLDLELRGPTDESRAALATLLDELSEVGLRIGRETRKGHGHLRIDSISMTEFALTADNFVDWLLTRHQTDADRVWETAVSATDFIAEHLDRDRTAAGEFRPWGGVRFDLSWRPDDPVAVATPAQMEAGAGEPDRYEATRLIGQLRIRSERIGRTIWPQEQHPWEPSKDWSDRDDAPELDVADAITALFGSSKSAAFLSASNATLEHATHQVFDGVAIDRFSGGATDKLKFQTAAITNGTINASVTIDGFDTAHAGVLLRTVLDTVDGDLALGRRSSGGFGTVRLERIAVSARGDIPEELSDEPSAQWVPLSTAFQEGGFPTRGAVVDALRADAESVGDWLLTAWRSSMPEEAA